MGTRDHRPAVTKVHARAKRAKFGGLVRLYNFEMYTRAHPNKLFFESVQVYARDCMPTVTTD